MVGTIFWLHTKNITYHELYINVYVYVSAEGRWVLNWLRYSAYNDLSQLVCGTNYTKTHIVLRQGSKFARDEVFTKWW